MSLLRRLAAGALAAAALLAAPAASNAQLVIELDTYIDSYPMFVPPPSAGPWVRVTFTNAGSGQVIMKCENLLGVGKVSSLYLNVKPDSFFDFPEATITHISGTQVGTWWQAKNSFLWGDGGTHDIAVDFAGKLPPGGSSTVLITSSAPGFDASWFNASAETPGPPADEMYRAAARLGSIGPTVFDPVTYQFIEPKGESAIGSVAEGSGIGSLMPTDELIAGFIAIDVGVGHIYWDDPRIFFGEDVWDLVAAEGRLVVNTRTDGAGVSTNSEAINVGLRRRRDGQEGLRFVINVGAFRVLSKRGKVKVVEFDYAIHDSGGPIERRSFSSQRR